eukprot:TRINITY_DN21270_c0_g1_i1.p1 TRINITY_DN21270_c0_g1~~TRINITY_DN21270_c0_g1_i1.p1  ORF type:complete len:273 (+),score=63.01 TRINITY_DN21270_c0_g1_i1:99-917(+)
MRRWFSTTTVARKKEGWHMVSSPKTQKDSFKVKATTQIVDTHPAVGIMEKMAAKREDKNMILAETKERVRRFNKWAKTEWMYKYTARLMMLGILYLIWEASKAKAVLRIFSRRAEYAAWMKKEEERELENTKTRRKQAQEVLKNFHLTHPRPTDSELEVLKQSVTNILRPSNYSSSQIWEQRLNTYKEHARVEREAFLRTKGFTGSDTRISTAIVVEGSDTYKKFDEFPAGFGKEVPSAETVRKQEAHEMAIRENEERIKSWEEFVGSMTKK